MNKHIVALDVDHTLLHHKGLEERITNFGEQVEAKPDLARRYLAAHAVHFTCVAFLEAIGRSDLMPELEAELIDQFGMSYYPDVVDFLEWARERSQLAIATQGNPHLQRLKIEPIRHLVEDVLITEEPLTKGLLLKKRYPPGLPITLVDDRSNELDAAAHSLSNHSSRLSLFQIIRHDATHNTRGAHPTITTLDDIRSTIDV